jgi:hypothetical protein
MADRGSLTPKNRAEFKGYATPEIWQGMADYGMGRSDSFPSRFDMGTTGEDEVKFLEMMMIAFREQEDRRRLERAKGTKERVLMPGDQALIDRGAG